jgi:membrane protein DedA with SNARE-associated domain
VLVHHRRSAAGRVRGLGEIFQFVGAHGYAVIVVWVLLDQMGVPIPAIPMLIVAGAMAGAGELNFGGVMVAAVGGCVPSDVMWFVAGRRRGGAVLKMLCKVSLEPDSCVRTTQNTFERYGPRSLLLAKLIPGYQTLSPALAGMSGMSLGRFLAFDVPGAFLWSAAFVVPGYLLRDRLETALALVSEFGSGVALVAGGGFAAYIAWKFGNRRRFLRSLRIARMLPDELKRSVDEGQGVAIIDLRDGFSRELQPIQIPGAQVMTVEELDARHEEIPRDRDIVLYCT